VLYSIDKKYSPEVVNIELTNLCNLHCKMCYRNEMNYPCGKMSWDLFKEIVLKIKQEKGAIKKVYLHWRGEPLVVSYLPAAIKFIKDNLSVSVILFTNGVLLGADLAEQILLANVDIVSVSLDANSDTVFNDIRGEAVVDVVKTNLGKLIQIRNSVKKNTKINITSVLLPDNCFEIQKIVQEWRTKVDHIQIKENAMRGNTVFKSQKSNSNGQEVCPFPFTTMFIAWDGFCYPCCMDVSGSVNLGHISEGTILSLWNNERITKTRRGFLEKNSLEKVCVGCARV